MRYAPNLLLIGSANRDSGKTLLASRIIETLAGRLAISAAKVTTVRERGGQCPHGGQGCGVCTELNGDYCLTEETEPGSAKDTQRLLAAGAHKVFWLRVIEEKLADGADTLMERLGKVPAVCESNSLRTVLEPGLFLLCRRERKAAMKASAATVAAEADRTVTFDGTHFDCDLSTITVADGQWRMPYAASAIILAGGVGRRMGCGNTRLPLGDRTLLQACCDSVGPHFSQVLLSVREKPATPVAGAITVPDGQPARGPLAGLYRALNASAFDRNFVIGCDMPGPDLRLMRRLFRGLRDDVDAVVPVTPTGVEPLYGVYHKRIIPALREAMEEDTPTIKEFLTRIRTAQIPTETALHNFNSMEEYRRFPAKADKTP